MMKTVVCKSRGMRVDAGFTLLELVIVLLILSILATIAIQMIEPQVDQTRFEATQKTIRNVEDAIAAERTSSDGTHSYVGYFVDLGGFPRAVPDPIDPSVLTLRSLSINPSFAPFAIRPASLAAVANIIDGSNQDRDRQKIDADSAVMIGSGWRGPYLQLPVGANVLRDGWGTQLIGVEGGANTYLRGIGDSDVVATGQEVVGVRSFGRDNLLGGIDYDMDLPATLNLTPERLAGTVSGTVVICISASELEPNIDHVIVQLYYPDAATGTGLVRAERANVVSLGESGPSEFQFSFEFFEEYEDAGGQTVTKPVLFPVGPRAIRAYYDSSPIDAAEDYAAKQSVKKSRIKQLIIHPTTNGGIELVVDATP